MSLTFSDKIRKHTNVSTIQVCEYVNQQTHTHTYIHLCMYSHSTFLEITYISKRHMYLN